MRGIYKVFWRKKKSEMSVLCFFDGIIAPCHRVSFCMLVKCKKGKDKKCCWNLKGEEEEAKESCVVWLKSYLHNSSFLLMQIASKTLITTNWIVTNYIDVSFSLLSSLYCFFHHHPHHHHSNPTTAPVRFENVTISGLCRISED